MTDERVATDPMATTRRRVFTGAGAAGALAVLAACQPEPNDPANFEVPEAGGTPGNNKNNNNDDNPGDQDNDGQTPEGLVATADVAVGGGVILTDQDLVVTQPEQGEWRAFSATCTHQGCLVSEIRGDVIYCNCHGSEYSIWDGSVVQEASGVAPGTQEALPPENIEVDGDWVVRG